MINDEAGVGFRLSKQLIKKNYKVTLFAKNKKIYAYPKWTKLYKNKFDEFILKRIKINDFDIIHINYLINWASLGLLLKKTKKQIILHAHGDDSRPTNVFTKLVQRLVASKSKILLYSTPDLYDSLDWFKGSKTFLPNPVSITKYSGKTKYNRRVLVFGTLYKIKKIEKIFETIKNLDYQFDIIDIGPDKDYYKEIAPKNIKFINPIKNENIKKELSKYHLIIGGSQDGSIRVCELEAMSLGIPTLFPFKYNSFYPEPLSMPKFNEESIKKYYGDYELGKKQREWVSKYHGVKNVTDKLITIYMNASNKF